MKRIITTLILFTFFSVSKAQITFQSTYSDFAHCDAKTVIQNSDGSYVFLGSIVVQGDSSDIILTKIDSVGSTIFSIIYSSIRSNDTLLNDYGFDIKSTPDNGYIICGTTFGSSHDMNFNDVVVIKTDAFGAIDWYNIYGQAGNDEGYSISLSTDDGYFIAGHTNSDGLNNNGGFVMKINSIGDPIWYHIDHLAGDAHFNSGCVTSDSGFVAVGSTTYFSDSADVFAVKYTNDGTFKWAKRFGARGDQEGNSVTATADGGCILTGSSSPDNSLDSTDMLIAKLDTGGTIEWSKTYNHLYEDKATNIIHLNDGNYAITGYSNGTNTFAPVRMVDFLKINSTGDTLHSQMYGDFTFDCFSSGISETADHGFVMGGVTYGLAGPQGAAYLIKTDSTGTGPLCPFNPLLITPSSITLSDSSGCATNTFFPLYTSDIPGRVSNSISFGVICLSINVEENSSTNPAIAIYPNPVLQELNIDMNRYDTQFESLIISDVFGRVIFKKEIHSDESILHLDVSTFHSGIFLIELRGDKNYTARKFVKLD